MKKTLATIALGLVTSVAAFGQAEINFANGATGVNSPCYGPDDATKLSGSNYLADLFFGAAGTATTALTDDGLHVGFGTGPTAGIFLGGAQVLPIAAGPVELQIRVWQAAAGASYAQATGGATDWSYGASDLGIYAANGGTALAASTAITLTLPASPTPTPNMVGLVPFSVLQPIPEPSTIAVGALCAVSAFLAHRRRQKA